MTKALFRLWVNFKSNIYSCLKKMTNTRSMANLFKKKK